jgi:type II secretory pathway pseudopilin PulG
MIVVTIIGILAAIAVPAFSGYVYRSRTAEATTFLGEIRTRQESYRAEFGNYVTATWCPAALVANGGALTWPAAPPAGWADLGAAPDGPTRFQVQVGSGFPGQAPPAQTNLPVNDFWFWAQARGDLDGDGTQVVFESYSHSNHVWVSQGKGWE